LTSEEGSLYSTLLRSPQIVGAARLAAGQSHCKINCGLADAGPKKED